MTLDDPQWCTPEDLILVTTNNFALIWPDGQKAAKGTGATMGIGTFTLGSLGNVSSVTEGMPCLLRAADETTEAARRLEPSGWEPFIVAAVGVNSLTLRRVGMAPGWSPAADVSLDQIDYIVVDVAPQIVITCDWYRRSLNHDMKSDLIVSDDLRRLAQYGTAALLFENEAENPGDPKDPLGAMATRFRKQADSILDQVASRRRSGHLIDRVPLMTHRPTTLRE